MKNTIYSFAMLIVFLNFSFGQNKSNKETEQKIDQYLKEIIEINEIPGTAVAVIKDGKVIYEKYFGKASLEENIPVDKTTSFKVFSTTKLITAVGIFQLIEKGKIALSDPVSKYLSDLPKEWQNVQIGNLLSHSSGLPDYFKYTDFPYTAPYLERISFLGQKPIQFTPGNQYSYNQTNYLLLTKIIEKITGQTFEDYIFQNQFPDHGSDVFFCSDFAKLTSSAVRYTYNIETKKYQQITFNSGPDSHSANGLNITLSQLIKWNQNLDNDLYLKKETKVAMWSPFQFTNQKDVFAYGWECQPVNNHSSYGFSGGNVTAFRKFPDNNLTVIFLSNSNKYMYLPAFDDVVYRIGGIIDPSLINLKEEEKENITINFLKQDFTKAKDYYFAVKKQHPDWNFEQRLNLIGYSLMRSDRLKDATKIFELNAIEHPNSGNVYDSLAESYFKNNQLELSKENYKKSLALTPENSNAKEMLKKIDELLAK
ncbi:serine hydrolase [Flavobacterium sp. DG2-3]|uniref:serine hydrolase n=1 Tax=Flavobacterium sp. DG2-3 TaxID=3068317 RepID=UPI00273DA505|nr:serine hydrolase [Flavobacterium sp. DG2-3]MDP5198757.1 serine hydrolase [Flavobacterium sp. DG2-3]